MRVGTGVAGWAVRNGYADSDASYELGVEKA